MSLYVHAVIKVLSPLACNQATFDELIHFRIFNAIYKKKDHVLAAFMQPMIVALTHRHDIIVSQTSVQHATLVSTPRCCVSQSCTLDFASQKYST